MKIDFTFNSIEEWAEWYNTWAWRITEVDNENCLSVLSEDERFVVDNGKVHELDWQS